MRILAVRGRNLASLAGDFEVRLDAPPLGDAGLFAITGKTGAGKSTILDALCLALYDQMPRLPGGIGVEVGRADDRPGTRLRSNDARSILRRGEGEGFAEVDFRGVDGRRYRARWIVRRSREKADGRFQNQEMQLTDLDGGEVLGRTKTEVLRHIEERLGLTFEQFRRSVLLAQGDFAAFLRAAPKERADLLERITGTDIYGRLSVAAHQRAAEERRQLDLLEQRLGERRPLDDDARRDLEERLAEARRRLDDRHREQARYREAERWYQTLDQLTGERDQAAAGLADAEADLVAAAPRRQAWERIRALQPLRLPLNEFDRASAALAAARGTLEALEAEERRLRDASERAEAALQSAGSARAAAEQARQAAAPALQEARRLDTLIQGAGEHLARAVRDRSEAEQALAAGQAAVADLERQRDAAGAALAQAQAWLEARAGLDPLAAQWDAWERELARYAEARRERDAARERLGQAEGSAADLTAKRADQTRLLEAMEADRTRLETQARELETEAARHDPGRLAGERDRLAARQRTLNGRRQLVEKARDARLRIEAQRVALDEEATRLAEHDGRLPALETELATAQATLTEAEAAHQAFLLASAANVEDLRRHLRDGEPCPVCGAEEHPWAHRDTALKGFARDWSERVSERRSAVLALSEERTRRRAESDQARRRTAELEKGLGAEQARLAEVLAAWGEGGEDDLHPADPFAEGLAGRIDAALSELAARLQAIGAEEAQARELAAARDRNRRDADALRLKREREQQRLTGLDGEIARADQAREKADLEWTRAEETLAKVAGLLAGPFAGIPDWRARLEADPDRFTADCGREVAQWRTRETARDQARETSRALDPRLAEAAARNSGAEQELARRGADVAAREAERSALRGQRAGLLDGRPADAVEQALDAALAQSRDASERARAGRDQAREALTGVRGRIEAQRQDLGDRDDAAAKARAALDLQMAGQEVTESELRQALGRDHAWVERERQALADLDEARRAAQGLVEERGRRLEAHRTAEAPELERGAVTEGLGALTQALGAAQEEWGGLHGRVAEDDARREAARSLQAELARQRARFDTWEALRELIGSADGSRFRTFAQGLTLELLVAHANVHLADLARRYLLQRVPGSDMDLQVVDREMGDEVRGIHSLSGGESFLVSLALALGLASLASDRVQVESLFIDEGFGALDADSLDLAIASLDALYSLGRQVGVISHVGTLVERIGVKVQVTKEGGGRSRLAVVTD